LVVVSLVLVQDEGVGDPILVEDILIFIVEGALVFNGVLGVVVEVARQVR
jgi:hypothetical protein